MNVPHAAARARGVRPSPVSAGAPRRRVIRLLCAVLVAAGLHGGATTVAAQSAQSAPAAPYTLTVSQKDGFFDVALRADGASLASIAADLSKRLRVSVQVGESVRQDAVTVAVAGATLEQALAALAPRVLIDYEVRQSLLPQPKAIYLLGPTDPAPPRNATARGFSQGLLITGNTEDTGAGAAQDALRISGDARFLTVTTKEQPLADVARAIGDVLGVPVQMKSDGAELVSLDLRAAAPEDVIPKLSPNIQLYLRVDLSQTGHTPLRLVVGPPDAK